jgi:tyrosyl-tRNA synthetase
VATGLVSSLSEARRAIGQGGVSLDGVRVEDETATVLGTLPGGVSVLRRGKKTLAGVFLD